MADPEWCNPSASSVALVPFEKMSHAMDESKIQNSLSNNDAKQLQPVGLGEVEGAKVTADTL